MKFKLITLVFLIIIFSPIHLAYANTSELDAWKEGLKECAAESEGIWIDIMVDESSSMWSPSYPGNDL